MTAVSGPVPARPDTAAVRARVLRACHEFYQTDDSSAAGAVVKYAADDLIALIRAQALQEAATAVEARREIVGSLISVDEVTAVILGLVDGGGT